jgi:arginyl-tRNA synthetase
MNPFDTPIVSLALRPLLVNRLQNIIYLRKKRLQTDGLEHDFDTNTVGSRIPLNQIKTEDQSWYVSAIAFKLAKPWGKPAIEVAHQITADLIQSIEDVADTIDPLPIDRLWQNFTIQAMPPGWIHLSLSNPGFAEWLQILVDCYPCQIEDGLVKDNTRNHIQVFSNSTHIFKIQHTHARCCSLLRLADRENLIQLTAENSANTAWICKITEPHPLPWMKQGRLQFQHGTEYHLIAELMTVLDTLSQFAVEVSVQNFQAQGEKLAIALCQAFYEFDAACRIVGEVRSKNLPLVQARLGLVAITRTVCAMLLQKWMNLPAPPEL